MARYLVNSQIHSLSGNVIKVTGFHNAITKVSGPILATCTKTLWGDYQVGGAELSFYSPTGVLGARGFVGPDVAELELHDVHHDRLEGGMNDYKFDRPGIKFYNLRTGTYVTNHDDVHNRVIAFAHLSAIKLINAQSRINLNPVPAVRKALSPDRWMGEMWESLKDRTLTQICLPGSHDAGTGRITARVTPSGDKIRELVTKIVADKFSALSQADKDLTDLMTTGGTKMLIDTSVATLRAMIPRLTQTQCLSIGDQLKQGCRFFDLRPALTHAGDKTFTLAHGEYMSREVRVKETCIEGGVEK